MNRTLYGYLLDSMAIYLTIYMCLVQLFCSALNSSQCYGIFQRSISQEMKSLFLFQVPLCLLTAGGLICVFGAALLLRSEFKSVLWDISKINFSGNEITISFPGAPMSLDSWRPYMCYRKCFGSSARPHGGVKVWLFFNMDNNHS